MNIYALLSYPKPNNNFYMHTYDSYSQLGEIIIQEEKCIYLIIEN